MQTKAVFNSMDAAFQSAEFLKTILDEMEYYGIIYP